MTEAGDADATTLLPWIRCNQGTPDFKTGSAVGLSSLVVISAPVAIAIDGSLCGDRGVLEPWETGYEVGLRCDNDMCMS
jgi:hypothetical protein